MADVELPDVEELVIEHLASTLKVRAAVEVPAKRPDRFLKVVRTGGPAINRVLERARVTVTAYGTDSTDANDLLRAARTLLLNAAGPVPLLRRAEEYAGPYWDPDPETGAARYTFSFELTVRARRV